MQKKELDDDDTSGEVQNLYSRANELSGIIFTYFAGRSLTLRAASVMRFLFVYLSDALF